MIKDERNTHKKKFDLQCIASFKYEMMMIFIFLRLDCTSSYLRQYDTRQRNSLAFLDCCSKSSAAGPSVDSEIRILVLEFDGHTQLYKDSNFVMGWDLCALD